MLAAPRQRSRFWVCALLVAAALFAATPGTATPPAATPPAEAAGNGKPKSGEPAPSVAKATGETAPPPVDGSADAERLLSTFVVPQGLSVKLFAAEPQLGNPVAIGLDERGRVFVAEEYRFNHGTEENRARGFFLDDDLQIKTLADRRKMYEKWADKFAGGMGWFQKYTDQIRLLEDSDGNGRADVSKVFARGFNDTLDGLLAGVMAVDGKVYATCIPHLWLLEDQDDDGVADTRKSLQTGFGVNCAYLGHDLHGLVMGPDGRIYYSIGDRGFDVDLPDGTHVNNPRNGAVFRSFPDGSGFEIIHKGLRNPQELAFDRFGNLFADDNNCDKGDHARLVYVVQGGNSGWNMSYQTMPEPYLVGPWHGEKMWHTYHPGQPAWIVPSLGKIGTGPSGFAYYPGLGLPERYRDHFFMCNFTGNGGIESFAVKPQGAAFEIEDYHDFMKIVRATDCEFGYDGKLYVSDFGVLKWDSLGGYGRIYTVFDPKVVAEPPVLAVARLMREGFDKRSTEELVALLSHADQRVRQRAQFAIAAKGPAAVETFKAAARQQADRTLRLHGLWGLWQLALKTPTIAAELVPFASDEDGEIRAQALKILGDVRYAKGAELYRQKLIDAEPRVKFFAAEAAGRIRDRAAIGELVALLRTNADQDAYLRHAAIHALTSIDDRAALEPFFGDPSASVRLALVVVLRNWLDPRVEKFLADADRNVVTEAARAIHDLPIESAMPALAALFDRYRQGAPAEADPLLRRIVSANYRLGSQTECERVAAVVANPGFSLAIRSEALAELALWSEPAPRDRVFGAWRPLEKRDPAIVREVLTRRVAELLAKTEGKLQTEAAQLIAKLEIPADDRTFYGWLADAKRPPQARVEALRLLAMRKYADLPKAITESLADREPRVRAAARDVLAASDAPRAIALIDSVLKDAQASLIEKQAGLATLSRAARPDSDAILLAHAGDLAARRLPAELELDVLLAAERRATPSLKAAVETYRQALPADDPLARFRAALAGGDASRGQALFTGHHVAQCLRCHKIQGTGGEAGPDLTEVAQRHPRELLLESLIVPSAKIAPGFGAVALEMIDGRVISGTLKAETDREVTLQLPDGKLVTLATADIEDRSNPQSAMPSMSETLRLDELRDLVEYLSTLKP